MPREQTRIGTALENASALMTSPRMRFWLPRHVAEAIKRFCGSIRGAETAIIPTASCQLDVPMSGEFNGSVSAHGGRWLNIGRYRYRSPRHFIVVRLPQLLPPRLTNLINDPGR